MSEYTPDNWLLFRLPNGKNYKVLGGWSGGYLDGDCWRLNSGVKAITGDGGYWYFKGFSGSVYKCRIASEHERFNMCGVPSQLVEKGCTLVKLTPGIIKEINNAKDDAGLNCQT